MLCTNCNQQLPEGAKVCPNCKKPVPGGTSIQVAQNVGTVKGEVVGTILGKVAPTAGLSASTSQEIDTVAEGGSVVGTIIGGEGGQVNVGGQHHHGDIVQGDKQEVHTEGGAYVQGDVTTGGDFVGRDKIVHGDEVHGDKVGGDKIEVGNISGSSGIAIGRGARATVTSGLAGQDLDRLFTPLMNVLRDAPPEKRDEALQTAEALKEEVAKGKDADDSRVAKLLDGLVGLVPAAVSAVVSTFATPLLAGIAGPVTKFVLDQIQRK